MAAGAWANSAPSPRASRALAGRQQGQKQDNQGQAGGDPLQGVPQATG